MLKFPSCKIYCYFFPEKIKADIEEWKIEYILKLPDDKKIFPHIAKKCT